MILQSIPYLALTFSRTLMQSPLPYFWLSQIYLISLSNRNCPKIYISLHIPKLLSSIPSSNSPSITLRKTLSLRLLKNTSPKRRFVFLILARLDSIYIKHLFLTVSFKTKKESPFLTFLSVLVRSLQRLRQATVEFLESVWFSFIKRVLLARQLISLEPLKKMVMGASSQMYWRRVSRSVCQQPSFRHLHLTQSKNYLCPVSKWWFRPASITCWPSVSDPSFQYRLSKYYSPFQLVEQRSYRNNGQRLYSFFFSSFVPSFLDIFFVLKIVGCFQSVSDALDLLSSQLSQNYYLLDLLYIPLHNLHFFDFIAWLFIKVIMDDISCLIVQISAEYQTFSTLLQLINHFYKINQATFIQFHYL